MFPHLNWKAYEVILKLLQKFSMRSRKVICMLMSGRYMTCASCCSLKETHTMERKKQIPINTAPLFYLEAERVIHEYYREKIICNANEETRVLLRILIRQVKNELYKSQVDGRSFCLMFKKRTTPSIENFGYIFLGYVNPNRYHLQN